MRLSQPSLPTCAPACSRFLPVVVWTVVFFGLSTPFVHGQHASSDSIINSLRDVPVNQVREIRDSLNGVKGFPRGTIDQLDLYLDLENRDRVQVAALLDSLFDEGQIPIINLISHYTAAHPPKPPPPPVEIPAGTIPLDTLQVTDSVAADSTKKSKYKPSLVAASFELRPGNEVTVHELRIFGNILPRVDYFSWTTTRSFYDNDVSFLTLVDLYTPIVGGLSFVQETQFARGIGTDIRFGWWYFNVWGDFSAFIINTTNVEEWQNIEFLSTLQYAPRMTDSVRWLFKTETLTIWTKDGFLVSVERPRLGVLYKQWQFGLSEDFIHSGPDFEFDNLHAVFFRKSF